MQIDERRIAVFIDFENVAMGVRESRYGNFDIDLVLKRLVEKGKITVKRAYSDWHRYTEFKRAFHQAAIELIDVPQSRYSGKNSADIRMVVDALDLSYQRDHIDTFVLVSGDSDFSPLVSKLREYGRYVIGMGVKQSSSDLLINNCDEFIFYEDLVRPTTENTRLAPKLNGLPRKKAEALLLVVETFEALQREGKEVIYGSVIKQTLVRKLPSFNETYFGYPSFSRLLEDAAENKLLQLTKDEKSGGYIVNLSGDGTGTEAPSEEQVGSTLSAGESPPSAGKSSAPTRTRSSRGRRQGAREKARSDPQPAVEAAPADPQTGATPQAVTETPEAPAESPLPGETTSAEQSTEPSSPVEKKVARPRRRSPRSRAAGSRKAAAQAAEKAPATEASAAPAPEVAAVPPDQAPAAAPPDQPAERASATGASPVGMLAEVEQPPPGDATPAEQSTEPSPPAEKKPARPRRRSSRSRAAGSTKAAAEAAEEAPATEAVAVPPTEAAAAPPEQPAESPSATATSPVGAQTAVQEPLPGEPASAEPSTEPSSPVEKKAARPRRRSSRSRGAGSRKAAAKAAEEAPAAEASAAPPTEVATAPPAQPAEIASATTASSEEEQPQPVQLPLGEATSAEPSTEPSPPSEKKAVRPRRRSPRSRAAASRKSAAKAAQEAPPAEVPATSPEQPPESPPAAATGGQTSVEEASPVEAPAADGLLLTEAAAPTTGSGSDVATAPKPRRRTSTARTRTTRSKTTRSRKTPARDTEPTLFSQIEDSTE